MLILLNAESLAAKQNSTIGARRTGRLTTDSHREFACELRMRFFKNIRLSVQLFALVVVTLAIASALIAYSMQQVRSTQGTLKHTIDNRMVSGQSIQGVADALSLSLEASLDVIEKKQTALEAHDQIKKAIDKARDDWDNYFLGDMIPEEQELADETTPMLDGAYGKIDKLLKKLESQRRGGPRRLAQRDAAARAGRWREPISRS